VTVATPKELVSLDNRLANVEYQSRQHAERLVGVIQRLDHIEEIGRVIQAQLDRIGGLLVQLLDERAPITEPDVEQLTDPATLERR
jgi:hypothetical protein